MALKAVMALKAIDIFYSLDKNVKLILLQSWQLPPKHKKQYKPC